MIPRVKVLSKQIKVHKTVQLAFAVYTHLDTIEIGVFFEYRISKDKQKRIFQLEIKSHYRIFFVCIDTFLYK